jgi:hypothetical protein
MLTPDDNKSKKTLENFSVGGELTCGGKWSIFNYRNLNTKCNVDSFLIL